MRLRWVSALVLALWLLPGVARAEPLRVLAASSLTEVLTEIGQRYAAATGRPAPTLAFSASSQLVRQVEHGDPAGVVLTADETWMELLAERGRVTEHHALARNRLVVVVPAGSDAAIKSPADLTRASVRSIAVAAAQVPAGQRAREALDAVGLREALADKLIIGRNVRSALALSDRNEVDAAIVYSTDALASNASEVAFTFDDDTHNPIVYTVGLTADATAGEAREFVEFVRGTEAKEAFAAAGFVTSGTPSEAGPGWRGDDAPGGLSPFWLTLWVAGMSLLISLVPAVLLGWLLARREFVGKTALSTVLMTPLVLPPVVVGFLLLEVFGRNGPFDAIGIHLAFNRWGAVVAATVVGFPLLVLMSRLAIEAVDRHYEEVAQTLGLTPLRAFVRVSLPMAAPGLLAGCVLAYARALGEFGATVVLATDVPGQTRTLALAIFALYEQPGLESEAHTLVWVSIALCAVSLVAYERLSKIQKARLAGMR